MDLQSAYKTLETLRSEIAALKTAVSESSDMADLSKLSEELSAVQRNDLRMSDIEAVPGARTPKWYTLDIDYASGETQSKARALEISPDGVFVCTQMQAYYKVLDRTEDHYPPTYGQVFPPPGEDQIDFAYGRYLPCTAAYPFLAGIFYNPVQVAGTTQNTDLDPGQGNYFYPIPEFSFQMEVVGSGAFWTSKPIPSASLFGVTEPKYLGMSAYLDRGERLVITAKPETRVPLTGKVRFVLHGYQILGNIDLSKYLG
jgi:hypothetical protein